VGEGRLDVGCSRIDLSQVFGGQNIGVTQVREHISLVTVMRYPFGYFGYSTDENSDAIAALKTLLASTD
jgi:hypothetical protein